MPEICHVQKDTTTTPCHGGEVHKFRCGNFGEVTIELTYANAKGVSTNVGATKILDVRVGPEKTSLPAEHPVRCCLVEHFERLHAKPAAPKLAN